MYVVMGCQGQGISPLTLDVLYNFRSRLALGAGSSIHVVNIIVKEYKTKRHSDNQPLIYDLCLKVLKVHLKIKMYLTPFVIKS